MSYILGALKKAEKERKRDRSLNLEDWDQEEWNKPKEPSITNNLMLYLVLAMLMFVLIIFSWLAYRILITPNQATYSDASTEQAGSAQIDTREVEQKERIESDQIIDASSDEVVPVYVDSPSDTQATSVTENSRQSASPQKSSSSAELPEFSGHIYFPNNARLSRVFSGSNAYREDEMVGGYRVEEIREGEVLLSLGGKEFVVELDQ